MQKKNVRKWIYYTKLKTLKYIIAPKSAAFFLVRSKEIILINIKILIIIGNNTKWIIMDNNIKFYL